MTKETTLTEMVGAKQLELMQKLGRIEYDTTQGGNVNLVRIDPGNINGRARLFIETERK